jgi:hypothetical protein
MGELRAIVHQMAFQPLERHSIASISEMLDEAKLSDDPDDSEDWHIIRTPGFSPICSICQQMLNRIKNRQHNPPAQSIELLTTSIPVEKRSRAGCRLCSLFNFYLGESHSGNACFTYDYRQRNNFSIELVKRRWVNGREHWIEPEVDALLVIRPVSSKGFNLEHSTCLFNVTTTDIW